MIYDLITLCQSNSIYLYVNVYTCRERNEFERLEDENWYRESLRLQRVMAQAEVEDQRVRKAYNRDTLEYLQNQVDMKRHQTKIDASTGQISGDFYEKFGTSCR